MWLMDKRNNMPLCTITTDYGATYEVKQICAAPLRYVEWVTGPLENAPLHRDGRTFQECIDLIGLLIANSIRVQGAISGLFQGGEHAAH